MIKPELFNFNFQQVSNGDTGLAVGGRLYKEYVDGKPSDNYTGLSLDIVLPKARYEKITVKIPGLIHQIKPEDFETRDSIPVRIKDFNAKFYRTNSGEYALSCKGTAVEEVKEVKNV